MCTVRLISNNFISSAFCDQSHGFSSFLILIYKNSSYIKLSDMELKTIQSYMILSVAIFLVLPLTVYLTVQLVRYWHSTLIVKRRRPVVIALLLMIIYFTLVEWPSYAVEHLLGHDHVNYILLFITIPARLAFILLINTRVWLLYFDYNYHHTLSRKPWQIFLSRSSIDENWFLINRQRLGSAKFIIKWIIIPIVILRAIAYFTMCFGFGIANESIDAGTICFFSICSFIFIGIVWSKYPEYHDIYFIRSELKWLCFSALVMVLTYFVDWMLLTFRVDRRIELDIGFAQLLINEFTGKFEIRASPSLKHPQRVPLENYVRNAVRQKLNRLRPTLRGCSYSDLDGTGCFVMFMMIEYPHWKSTHLLRKMKIKKMNGTRVPSESTDFETNESMEEIIAMTKTAKMLDWGSEITTINGYEQFAGFLSKEFAIENLLFVTEVCTYLLFIMTML